MRSVIFITIFLLVTDTLATEDNEIDDAFQDESGEVHSGMGSDEQYSDEFKNDLCYDHKCPEGSECIIDDNKQPVCTCIQSCPIQMDPEFKVCSNLNETWSSECELTRMRCLCEHGAPECSYKKIEHLHIDYLGECKALEPCHSDEIEDFSRRMANWLFNVMKMLAIRKTLPEEYMFMKLRAERQNENNEQPTDPIIWKFCDLDIHPRDRYISRHELSQLITSLFPTEHCIIPFLISCDMNKDEKISLREWGSCLGLSEDEIEDKCSPVF